MAPARGSSPHLVSPAPAPSLAEGFKARLVLLDAPALRPGLFSYWPSEQVIRHWKGAPPPSPCNEAVGVHPPLSGPSDHYIGVVPLTGLSGDCEAQTLDSMRRLP